MNKICEQVLRFALATALISGGCSDDEDPGTVERAGSTSTTAATTTTTGPATTTTLVPCPVPPPDDSARGPDVIGAADVDADGEDEIWARTGSGAATTIVGLFSLEDCELTQVTFESGLPVELPVGGSVGTTSGVECAPAGGLLVHTATYTGDGSDDRYAVETTAYELEGGVLVEAERSTTDTAASDPEFVRYTTFRCGDLSL